MTDKEIAEALKVSRTKAFFGKKAMFPIISKVWAAESVHIIHHIINSINWED